jgi:hypothetical protein
MELRVPTRNKTPDVTGHATRLRGGAEGFVVMTYRYLQICGCALDQQHVSGRQIHPSISRRFTLAVEK